GGCGDGRKLQSCTTGQELVEGGLGTDGWRWLPVAKRWPHFPLRRDCNMVKTYDYLLKLLLTGDRGIDFKIRTIGLDGKRIKLQIWDTAGQEHFRMITTAYYRGTMGIMLVYDITNEKSFNNIRNWIQNIEKHASADVKKMILWNKCDLLRSSPPGLGHAHL
ncbi:hypothetical protein MC885_000405, partial [Smutsia gigantea]